MLLNTLFLLKWEVPTTALLLSLTHLPVHFKRVVSSRFRDVF